MASVTCRDKFAVEMARRKVAFHADEKWDKIILWGLFKYNKELQKAFDDGSLINHPNYGPENRTCWVIPSREYWQNSIKPLVEQHTLEELQATSSSRYKHFELQL